MKDNNSFIGGSLLTQYNDVYARYFVMYIQQMQELGIRIEAVTPHGPVSHKRRYELEEILRGCAAKRIYISAFHNFAEFGRHKSQIAWETEVWIAEMPEHMIHYNGERFLEPYE